jgi:hypothetical protein
MSDDTDFVIGLFIRRQNQSFSVPSEEISRLILRTQVRASGYPGYQHGLSHNIISEEVQVETKKVRELQG